jgi:hypothetical protein
MLEIMSKKQKDISTYFVSNKKHEGHDDKNNSQPSRTNNFNSADCNNESDVINNEEVSAVACPLFFDQNSNNTINAHVNDDDIGLYVSNNTAKDDFSLLNHAFNCISTHEKCDYHRLSVTQAAECVQRYSDVNVLLNDIIVDQENEKRIILASIIKCILFVSKQNIAFKGNDDNGLPNDENVNPGNFKSFILFRAEAGDEALQKHFSYCHNDAIYLSWKIQNELINSCACFIRNLLLNEIINQNTFYAVIPTRKIS